MNIDCWLIQGHQSPESRLRLSFTGSGGDLRHMAEKGEVQWEFEWWFHGKLWWFRGNLNGGFMGIDDGFMGICRGLIGFHGGSNGISWD